MSHLAAEDIPEEIAIAIIGMAGRFPGAQNIAEYWQNLRDGIESITFFTDEQLRAEGVAEEWVRDPDYVKAAPVLEGIEFFDAAFFGCTPREAQIMDPQHRLFLECSWTALEHAGYNPDSYEGQVGVFAGCAQNTYALANLARNSDLVARVGKFQMMLANEKDFLPTRVSYKLNLHGPSVSIQTACSTSLVAIHSACQSLFNEECDIALAGGVTVRAEQLRGYFYQAGGITSPDGHCRAFDARAQGTVSGSGAGVVVLKRYSEALRDNDTIHAIIKGSAINNDGKRKIGYTAPSVDGQAEVITAALEVAGVDPGTLSYIETHGTGTALGDPIEILGLTQAFLHKTAEQGFCAIGSVKTNIGHLDAAAGVAGLIKVVEALKHRQIPPSLHFEHPHPQIDFVNSPFYVNRSLQDWEAPGGPRRAGVSSFGIGGTNAHVILEEAPAGACVASERRWHLLFLSARTASALEALTRQLAEHLKNHPQTALEDVAYTLQVGRKAFAHRRMILCSTLQQAIQALEQSNPAQVVTTKATPKSLVFLFPGQGAQHIDMAREVYLCEPVFRQEVDRCAELLSPHLGADIRPMFYPTADQVASAQELLYQTRFTQPALFVIEYALARLWMHRGVEPQAMMGHSIGEYVAACLAGVFSLEAALELMVTRGKLIQQLPTGSMLAVPLSEKDTREQLEADLSIAAVNTPSQCIVSGPSSSIEACQERLQQHTIQSTLLHTSHAFHSQMMEPIIEHFTAFVSKMDLSSPQIPFISNLTGTWITPEQATDASYWARHLRQTVRFAQGIQTCAQQDAHLLEVGPGSTLTALAQRNGISRRCVTQSLHRIGNDQSDMMIMAQAVGELWMAGVQFNWSHLYEHERRQRIPLPTYPFERQKYWIT